MSIFDLIFIAVFLITVITLVATAVAAIRRRGRRALGILRVLGVFVAAYLAVVAVVSLASPQRVLSLHEPQCFDDWCISVDHVEQTPAGADISYEVTLRLFSRAHRVSQRENGGSVYVLDDRGRRYEPAKDPQAVPFNVLLGPGDSALATRRFTLPADARNPGLVFAHGRFPGLFIIGNNESLFHKPTIVRFP
jgi:hypothetical protein